MPQAVDSNRRPIGSRKWKLFHDLAATLANRGVTPNAISLSSIACGFAAGIAFASTSNIESEALCRIAWLVGAAFIQLRLIANLLDGLVAVEGGKGSVTGELYNEVPDRISDVAIMLGLGYSQVGSPLLGAIAGIVCVFVAYIRAMGASLGVGQVFLGPLAKPQRMALATLVALFFASTPQKWQAVWEGWTLIDLFLALIIVGGCFTAWRRLRRIASLLQQQ